MEYVRVVYPTARPVYIDGAASGATNAVLRLDAGTHVFDLGVPADYEPVSQQVTVQGTTVLTPKAITFTQRGG